jgi:hypothetical protein
MDRCQRSTGADRFDGGFSHGLRGIAKLFGVGLAQARVVLVVYTLTALLYWLQPIL